ncbi:MAG: UbiA family prenyltransferase [Acidobacteria bacterium]|nr:UbiA family prenyltransferase [Acidobacteriota bacterium]
MIKFEHTLFALPFAFMGMMFAAGGWPGWRLFLLVTLAMVFARSAAMAFNRLVDVDVDGENPRTKDRSLPAGRLSTRFVAVYVILNSIAFIAVCGFINPLAFFLSPLALGLVLFYSYTKRFTSFSHLVLGLGLAIAPTGGWIAVTGNFAVPPLLLSGAVLFWVAGFDVMYSLQDVEFDRVKGLHSIPARMGTGRSLLLARSFHLLTFILLAVFSLAVNAGVWFNIGVGISALLLVYEHRLVSEDDLSRLNAAFFTVNSFVSILLLVCTVLKYSV